MASERVIHEADGVRIIDDLTVDPIKRGVVQIWNQYDADDGEWVTERSGMVPWHWLEKHFTSNDEALRDYDAKLHLQLFLREIAGHLGVNGAEEKSDFDVTKECVEAVKHMIPAPKFKVGQGLFFIGTGKPEYFENDDVSYSERNDCTWWYDVLRKDQHRLHTTQAPQDLCFDSEQAARDALEGE